ncbi:MAG: hypothetical protein ACKVQW_05140 [Pyrinomonadaceae bacterium]
MPMPGGGPPARPDWVKDFDANKDGKIDSTEFQSAIDASFVRFDKNGDGSVDPNEIQRPRPDGRPMPPADQVMRPQRPPAGPPPGPGITPEGGRVLPPFFFADRVADGVSTSKPEFEKIVRNVFTEMDKNGDGFLSQEESRPPKRPGVGPVGGTPPPPPPNARFIAAELRFGDKLIAGQPFSADVVIEDTRRLYDGSTVTKQRRGAIYRDGQGRTRREQPLEPVGGFNIVGSDNKPLSLVFINDFVAKTQTFLNLNNKVARTSGLGPQANPFENNQPEDAKTESLGTRTIEGVRVEGTKTTFEIPVGRLGNDKPIAVITESWFSPELGVIVMSRHVDPLAGEHVFKLVNLKRGEPSAELFNIPAGFRVENSEPRKERM